MSILTAPDKPRITRITRPSFDPNRDARKCAHCGGRTGWRQWHSIGGAWAHCPPHELIEAEHASMVHQCSTLCALGGAA